MWSFAKTLNSNSIEINTHKKTLLCDCNDEHIADAIANYKGKVVEFNPSKD
jgi:hypothetical protein